MKKSRWSSWMNSIASFRHKMNSLSVQSTKPRLAKSRSLRLEPLEERQLLTVYSINSLGDGVAQDGYVTLREAIEAASTNLAVGDAPAGDDLEADVINFDSTKFPSGTTITLQNGELSITDDLVITGLGADRVTIDAGGNSRIFYVNGADATFSDITIANGYAAYGGGICAVSGSDITVTDTVFLDNEANAASGTTSGGAGIYCINASLSVSGSTFSDNTAAYSGGGIRTLVTSGTPMDVTISNSNFSGNSGYIGGAIDIEARDDTNDKADISHIIAKGNSAVHGGGIGLYHCTLTLENSEISSNIATSRGGGIYSTGSLFDATITNSTIAANEASSGGGLHMLNGSTFTANNSIIALNTATTDSNVYGTLTQNSCIVDSDPLFIRNPSDGDYGDLRLLASSTAINTGNNTLVSGLTDLGGRARTVNDFVDKGAYEYQGIIYEVNSTDNDVVASDGKFTFNEALGAANNNVAYGDALAGSDVEDEPDIITFDASVFDSTSDIIYGQFSITDDLVITGPDADNLTIDGNNQSQVFNISSYVEATLSGMTITGGSATNGAGIYVNSGCDIELSNMVITDNTATICGGGIYGGPGSSIAVIDTIVSENQATNAASGTTSGGAGIYCINASLSVSGSTFSDNTAAYSGGGIRTLVTSGTPMDVTISNSNFSGNSGYIGGAIDIEARDDTNDKADISHIIAKGNSAVHGGGIGLYHCTLTLENSEISSNIATSRGGGIYSTGSLFDATITNSTIAANEASSGGGLHMLNGSTFTANNSIIALNTATTDSNVYGTLTQNSCIVDSDPLFIRNPSDGGDGWGDDPTTTEIDESLNDDYGDLRLLASSTAINTGDDTLASGLTDLNGNDRIIYQAVDIGAYESRYLFWDTNGATAGFGDGSSIWSTSYARWTTDCTGESATQVWDNSEDCIAVFNGTSGGTVWVNGNVVCQAIQFLDSDNIYDYTIEDYSPLYFGTITFTGDDSYIYVAGDDEATLAENDKATIDVRIAGSDGFHKNGDGALFLSGSLSNLSGKITANAGQAVLVTPDPFANTTSTTRWEEYGNGKVMGPGALDFHDTSTGGIYDTIVDRFYDDAFNDEELVYYEEGLNGEELVEVESHKSISREDMLAIFDVIADPNNLSTDTVTSDEFHDLQLIADVIDLDVNDPDDPSDHNDSSFRLQMIGYDSNSDDNNKALDPGYVNYLTGRVVDGIAVNDSGTVLDNLVSKWLKGTDHPNTTYNLYYGGNNYTSDFEYGTATGSLFVNGTSVDDMDQGLLGDCYFIAALGSIADAGIDGDDSGETSNGIVDAIEDMIIDNEDNTWTVRFYTYDDEDYEFKANYVTVDNQLPVNNTTDNLLVYANGGSPSILLYTPPNMSVSGGQGLNSELWLPLLEKAYAQWRNTSYSGLASGRMDDVYEQVFGEAASNVELRIYDPYNSPYYFPLTSAQEAEAKADLDSAISNGHAVTIGTEDGTGTTTYGLYQGHAYVIAGRDANGDYLLRNPHDGSSVLSSLTWAQLYNDCVEFMYADSSGTTTLHSLPVGYGASSGSISSDTMAAVYATLSASQTAGKLGHDGLATKATEDSLADLDTFQYDRVDAVLAADVAGQGADESLYDSEETWLTSSDSLDRNPASDAVDLLFAGVKASQIDGLLPEWDIDLPGLG